MPLKEKSNEHVTFRGFSSNQTILWDSAIEREPYKIKYDFQDVSKKGYVIQKRSIYYKI